MPLEITPLRTALIDAARRGFAAVRAAHPGENFYAYALYTDDDVSHVIPAASSEESLARVVEQYNEPDPAEQLHLRWETSEWEYEAEGDEHFDNFNRLLGEALESARDGDDSDDDDANWEQRQQLLQMMGDALAALDAEGLFGRGPQRERVLLMCAITDPDDDGSDFGFDSIRALNPPEVVAMFEKSWSAAEAPREFKGPPCQKCGQPLVAPRSLRCAFCGARRTDANQVRR
jgi:hypothetical protein